MPMHTNPTDVQIPLPYFLYQLTAEIIQFCDRFVSLKYFYKTKVSLCPNPQTRCRALILVTFRSICVLYLILTAIALSHTAE